MFSKYIYVLYTYLIRENGINFLSQREESGLRERKRERGSKSGVESVVCSYTVRGKSFLFSKGNFEFCYYDLVDEYLFSDISFEMFPICYVHL